MLYWKNKNIETLNEGELREALAGSIRMILLQKPNDQTDNIFVSFTIGMFVGMIVALAAEILTSMIF